MKLSDLVKDKSTKASIVEDCTHLIDTQVANKGGVSGLALKTAYRVVKGIGPKYVSGAIGRVLPDAFRALDPMWDEGLQVGDPVDYLVQHRSRTADILLSVTDARVNHTNGIVRTSYTKLRNSVKGDVEEAVPELAKIISAHLEPVQQQV